jgi:hypothetical protein
MRRTMHSSRFNTFRHTCSLLNTHASPRLLNNALLKALQLRQGLKHTQEQAPADQLQAKSRTCATPEESGRRQGAPCADAKAAIRWLSEVPRLTGMRDIDGCRGRGAARISASCACCASRRATQAHQAPQKVRPSPVPAGLG